MDGGYGLGGRPVIQDGIVESSDYGAMESGVFFTILDMQRKILPAMV
jgi:hypothetical protein